MSGNIGLQYVGTSGSNIEFKLQNKSSKAIRFRGEHKRQGRTDAFDTHVDCQTANGTTRFEHPIGMGLEERTSIEVAPGEQMRLLASNEISPGIKDAHCRLRLKLEDGTSVESDEFVP